MQAIVRAIAPSRRRERGWRRARATRRALLPPPGDRQARAGRRVGDGVFAGESEGRQWVTASDWSTCAIAWGCSLLQPVHWSSRGESGGESWRGRGEREAVHWTQPYPPFTSLWKKTYLSSSSNEEISHGRVSDQGRCHLQPYGCPGPVPPRRADNGL
jgi:hypothetical protein